LRLYRHYSFRFQIQGQRSSTLWMWQDQGGPIYEQRRYKPAVTPLCRYAAMPLRRLCCHVVMPIGVAVMSLYRHAAMSAMPLCCHAVSAVTPITPLMPLCSRYARYASISRCRRRQASPISRLRRHVKHVKFMPILPYCYVGYKPFTQLLCRHAVRAAVIMLLC
jgi:hypothetical protein